MCYSSKGRERDSTSTILFKKKKHYVLRQPHSKRAGHKAWFTVNLHRRNLNAPNSSPLSSFTTDVKNKEKSRLQPKHSFPSFHNKAPSRFWLAWNMHHTAPFRILVLHHSAVFSGLPSRCLYQSALLLLHATLSSSKSWLLKLFMYLCCRYWVPGPPLVWCLARPIRGPSEWCLGLFSSPRRSRAG
jgi:hypothetical protein